MIPRSLLVTLSLTMALYAQEPFTIGEVRTLHSAQLGEERTLNIALPQGYHADDTTRYPVVYLLDGSAEEDFIHVAGALQFAAFPWIGWQRPSIVVGIANVDRKRDFTFPTTVAEDKQRFPTTGGSAPFMRFLAEELIPFVEASYRTTPDRMLIGQSLGGLFATEVLFQRPSLFQRYLIVSPSLWWDAGSLLRRRPAFEEDPASAPRQVFIAVGKEGRRMEGDARRLHASVKKGGRIRTGFAYLPRHDHATILHQAVMDGFRWMAGVE